MKKIIIVFFIMVSIIFVSCSKTEEDKIAVIWTDRAEFVSYCEVFNNSQNDYKIIVEYKKNPADALINAETPPDIVIGSWLKGKSARVKFKKINNLFGEKKIDKNDFYPALLNLGSISGNQYLLPISFNLPMIIFSSANKFKTDNDFSISPDEIRNFSIQFNKMNKGAYTAMGFSPRWSDDFLYMNTKGFNASFEEENDFFSWNDKSLQNAINYIRTWSEEVNSSAGAEDEFKFKYLYDSPYVLVKNGKCLFYYASSDDIFSTPQKHLENIDFRWLSFNGKTPLKDDILYGGICSKSKNSRAAEAFFIWFFRVKTQELLLNRADEMDLMINPFGLAGGFSALRQVTEKLLPRYYPLLLAHLPQTQSFYAPHILPSNWPVLKREILMPYLKDACNTDLYPGPIPSLNKRIAEWYKNQ
ncbi:carbohydrate ABC transporter substrate-binding protein [Treponema denticola]|uniref:carbohydrate ABC transporter substrate-binding protein n=1 Tax=Treponema denticola TaxID=158 RepID=UPI002105B2D1|nr:carbohydrate ABC transporter substrate-binding protein [Treponema denticola]UTY23401.1 extracellular solute-binding protein [Treponema denticola]